MSKSDANLRQEATPVDRHVGSRLRFQRLLLDVSQRKLGEALGVTFQQVQKYEKGANRLSASKLQQAASLLHVPVGFFFEGVPLETALDDAVQPEQLPAGMAEFLTTTEGIHLTKAFLRITSPNLRRRLISLVEALAETEPEVA